MQFIYASVYLSMTSRSEISEKKKVLFSDLQGFSVFKYVLALGRFTFTDSSLRSILSLLQYSHNFYHPVIASHEALWQDGYLRWFAGI